MAKVRIEVELTKPLLQSVWVGQEEEVNPLKGFTQKLKYEGVPKYCKYYNLLGYSLLQYRVVEKEKEMEKEKENEKEKEKEKEINTHAQNDEQHKNEDNKTSTTRKKPKSNKWSFNSSYQE